MSGRTPAQQRWGLALARMHSMDRAFDMADTAKERAEEVGIELAETKRTLRIVIEDLKNRLDKIESWMPSISSGIVYLHERIDALESTAREPAGMVDLGQAKFNAKLYPELRDAVPEPLNTIVPINLLVHAWQRITSQSSLSDEDAALADELKAAFEGVAS